MTTRRAFLRETSAAAFGVGLGTLSISRGAHANDTARIKVGLVGCGGRGTGAASQALKAGDDVVLTAMGDAFSDRLEASRGELAKDEEIKNRIDVPQERCFIGLDAYKQVLAADVDVVILATPPGFRPTHFAAAVEAGKHAFLEKPVAVDAPGVRTVLEASKKAKEKNLAVGVGLQRRHQKSYIETIDQLQNGAIGDITFARVYWNSGGIWVQPRKADQSELEYQLRNWYYFNWLSGDHIVEQHIHNIDVINWLLGSHPVYAQGMGGRQVRTGEEFGEIFDHHAVEFEYENGVRLFSYCRQIAGCWSSVSEHAHGTNGFAVINDNVIRPKEGKVWRHRGRDSNPYQAEHDDLFASIRSGSPINEGEIGAISTMTAILGRMASYSGKRLRWDEAMASTKALMSGPCDWTTVPPAPHVAIPGQTEVA